MKTNVFQILDFDRVLFDTAKFIRAVTDEVERQDKGQGVALAEKVKEAYEHEETFFLFRYLRKTKGDAWVEQLAARVVANHGTAAFILPGAYERLAFAETFTDLRPAWGIMTYGDTVDQHMKLRIAGFEDAPVLITSTPNKSTIIASWRQPDGTFQLPAEFGDRLVQSITLEDDKLRAFKGMPDHTLGIWVTSDDNAPQRLADAQYAHVRISRDLHDSIEILKDKQ